MVYFLLVHENGRFHTKLYIYSGISPIDFVSLTHLLLGVIMHNNRIPWQVRGKSSKFYVGLTYMWFFRREAKNTIMRAVFRSFCRSCNSSVIKNFQQQTIKRLKFYIEIAVKGQELLTKVIVRSVWLISIHVSVKLSYLPGYRWHLTGNKQIGF